MRKIFILVVALLPFLGWGQDAAKWAKARDYLSCRLSLEAIRGKVRTDTSIRGRFARVEPVLAAATIDAPPSSAVLDGTLRDFARVRQVVVEPLSRVDVRSFAASPDGVRRLLDTAFAIVGRGYVIDEGAKAGLRTAVGSFLAGRSSGAGAGSGVAAAGRPGAADSVAKAAGGDAGASGVSGASAAGKKPVIALGGQPDGQGAASRGSRGFDFWVLLPIVLLAGVCVVLRHKYLEIKDELRARKVEMRSFNENYFGSGRSSGGGSGAGSRGSSGSGGSGSGGSGSGSGGSGGPGGGSSGSSGSAADRKAIERAIADSNVIAELNQAIGRLQLRIVQLEGKGGASAGSGSGSGSGASSSVGGSASGGGSGSAGGASSGAAGQGLLKGRSKGVEVEKGKPVDGADVFYMAGPVNNYFPNSAKSFTKDNTVYRFKVSPNRQDAEFELHTSGAPINEIVQLAESYIKAACDEENLPTYPVKNIITKKAGQAILDGDKWIIKSKALIRYE